MATNCTGNVTGIADFKDVPTDSHQGRYCDVHITRCTACAGSAVVSDRETGERWMVDIPSDYARDDYMAAYWAVEHSYYVPATHRPDPAPMFEVVAEFEYNEDFEYVEDEDGSQAYAEMRERQAEAGTWFGRDEDYPF